MQIDRASLEKLLSLNDRQLQHFITKLAADSGIDPATFNINLREILRYDAIQSFALAVSDAGCGRGLGTSSARACGEAPLRGERETCLGDRKAHGRRGSGAAASFGARRFP